MQVVRYEKISVRALPLVVCILLGMALCTPGYCLDPPVITPIDEFFIEHNGGPVQIAPPDWKLIVDGQVERPLALAIDEIRNYPSQTHMATIECGGNPFAFKAATLIGNAEWTGVPVRAILESAGTLGSAASVVFTALDGYSARIGLADIYGHDDIMLAYGMNGETLPPEQGYPLRLTFPGISGNMWVQWVTHVEVSAEEMPGEFIPLPPHCQIFTPAHGQTVDLGTQQRIYGMALAGDAEIDSVEVSTDGGSTWQTAAVLTSYVPNVWRHWEFNWSPSAPGTYTLAARAINTAGAVQPEAGFYGWAIFSIDVTASGPDDCVGGPPCEEGTYCDESTDRCVECLDDGHCGAYFVCEDNICTPECALNVTHGKIRSGKLTRPRKVTLKITGGENFDPYGAVDLGPLEVVGTQVNARKGVLRVRALVPAGIGPGTVAISVGGCSGGIEIL